MSFQLTLTNLQNVAAGNIATLKLPAGPGAPTYDQIKLVLSGGALDSHIEWIRLKANGRIIWDEGTGTRIKGRDAYRGVTSEAAFVVLDMTEPKARNGSAEQLLAAIPGSLVDDLSAEIKLAAGFVGAIKAVAIFRPPTQNPYIAKRLNTNQSFVAAGTDAAPNIIYLPTGSNGGKIKRVWIHESTNGLITGVQLRIANNVIHEATRAELENDQKRNGLTPQGSLVVLDFVADGNLAGMLDTEKAPMVELRMATGGAGTYTVYYEMVDPIGRL